MPRHFVDLWELSPDDACRLIAHSLELKRDDQQGKRPARLSGRTLGLLFEKPSLRTRVSFEAAISRLGGDAIFLRGEDVGLGIRESVADFARVLSQYVDAFAVRTFAHSTVEELARHATVPVINALSHAAHPCQAMADLMTIKELRGPLEGRKLLFIGDGNNVAMSLAVASALLGVHFVLAAPQEYEFPVDFQTRFAARFPKVPLVAERDLQKAVSGADVVYTDVWTSMGLEHEAEERRAIFAPYQVNDTLLARASRDVIFMHCLPAHRGEEVTSEVLDGPHSQVLLQSANRVHLQMALLMWLIGGKPAGVP
jgi:ornithine carbamoyltransferase